jgi:uncharacterized membrane protein YjfL (UPF0719 family)
MVWHARYIPHVLVAQQALQAAALLDRVSWAAVSVRLHLTAYSVVREEMQS